MRNGANRLSYLNLSINIQCTSIFVAAWKCWGDLKIKYSKSAFLDSCLCLHNSVTPSVSMFHIHSSE